MTEQELNLNVLSRLAVQGITNAGLYEPHVHAAINPGLKKLALMVSNSESFLRMQKEYTLSATSVVVRKAEAIITPSDLLIDSIMKNGTAVINNQRAIPVENILFLDYPASDSSVVRFHVSGNKIHFSTHESVLNGGNTTHPVKVISNFIPTLATLPMEFESDLIDIIAGQFGNVTATSMAGIREKEG